MVMSTLTVAGLNPALSILGDTQQFIFNDNLNLSTIQINNTFIPTALISAQNNLELQNNAFSGFRWIQLTNNTDTFGALTLQSFINAQPNGTDILTFRQDGKINIIPALANSLNMGNNRIINLLNPINPQDAVTKNYVDTNKAYGNCYMLANVTGTSVPGGISNYVKIAGTTTAGELNQFTMSSDNQLTYTGTLSIETYISVSIFGSDGTAINILTFSIYKNGILIPASQMTALPNQNNIVNVTIFAITGMVTGDYIEVYCADSVLTTVVIDTMTLNIIVI